MWLWWSRTDEEVGNCSQTVSRETFFLPHVDRVDNDVVVVSDD